MRLDTGLERATLERKCLEEPATACVFLSETMLSKEKGENNKCFPFIFYPAHITVTSPKFHFLDLLMSLSQYLPLFSNKAPVNVCQSAGTWLACVHSECKS